MKTRLDNFLIALIFMAVAVSGVLFVGSVEAADIGNSVGYVWMEGYGYVSLDGTGAGVDYGVTVADSVLSGYAWSEKLGWINFNDAGSLYAVTNDPSGNLCGHAWSEKVGYISFCDSSANKFYSVNVDTSGVITGYAWSEKVGYINFDDGGSLYGVTSSWVATVSNLAPVIFKRGIILKENIIVK